MLTQEVVKKQNESNMNSHLIKYSQIFPRSSTSSASSSKSPTPSRLLNRLNFSRSFPLQWETGQLGQLFFVSWIQNDRSNGKLQFRFSESTIFLVFSSRSLDIFEIEESRDSDDLQFSEWEMTIMCCLMLKPNEYLIIRKFCNNEPWLVKQTK